MEGHRLGDEAILNNNDKNKLKIMEQMYNSSIKYAYKCKSYKQMFTPYYWASRYFMKSNKKEKAVKYSILTIENAERYCPDSRQSYIDKLYCCLKYLKKNDRNNWKNFIKKYRKNSKNACLRKAIKDL